MIQDIRVAVVIPIFNAYEDTLACLNSLVKNTDFRHQILLVDDASTDVRIKELTAQFCQQYKNFTCWTSPENQGFVKSCNIGFSQIGDRDVVLLNSDTIVTANWLEQIMAAAYSDPKIATVTPLTNNGTICSIPKWLEFNELPDGYAVESFGELIHQTSLKKYPRIPTAVGFCMYVKQEVLKKIGYFDDLTFGRGYGEENDFCCRASEAGYIHIIDDSTFVYHAGSKSFSAEKENLIKQNYENLKLKHPNYFQKVAEFVASDPIEPILKNIDLQLTLDKIRKTYSILILLHNSVDSPKNHPLGGTERHCQALVEQLNNDIPMGVFYRDIPKQLLRLDLYYQGKKHEFAFSYPVELGFSTLTEKSFKDFLPKFLNYFQFNFIHIQHLLAFPLADVYSTCRELDIPYIVSLHDYHHICPNYNLLDWQSSFCFEIKTDDYCKKCISSYGYGKNYRELWATAALEGLQNAQLAIVPSEIAKSYLLREYPSLNADRVKAIGHGVYPQEYIENVSSLRQELIEDRLWRSHDNASPLIVAFVGALKNHKGSKIIKELFEKVASDPFLASRLNFLILGQIDFELSFPTLAISQIFTYEPQDLARLLAKADVAVFPNIWPETYCLTVDEALLAGVPAIATAIAAPSERIKAWQVGWVCESASAAEILALLLKIGDSRDLLQPILKNLIDLKIKSYEQMVSEYNDIYKQLSSKDDYDKNQPVLDNLAVFESYYQNPSTQTTKDYEIFFTGDTSESYVFKLAKKLKLVWIKDKFPRTWAFLKNIFWSINTEIIKKIIKAIRWILKV